jgi:hypothetical protein
LDRTVGGTLLDTKNFGYVTNDQSANQARYGASRRSLYLPVIRNAMYDVFTIFDYNDPSVPVDRRPATVVPHQALFLLNSPLVLEVAGKLAAQVRESASTRERIEALYQRALCRPPNDLERERAHRFLAAAADHDEPGAATEARAWQALCQVVLAASEFLYVD